VWDGLGIRGDGVILVLGVGREPLSVSILCVTAVSEAPRKLARRSRPTVSRRQNSALNAIFEDSGGDRGEDQERRRLKKIENLDLSSVSIYQASFLFFFIREDGF
jgi:hypothetical protein